MGFAFKGVANREWGVFRDRQSIGRRKLGADVATSVTDNMGMIFEPQKKTLFELAELTKTACKRSLVERVFRRPMAVLFMIGADAPTFRADFGSLLALITTSDDGWA
jgi:hypothetical protein